MAWTQIEIDALKAAIAKAERRVTYGDKTVEYRDISEMLKALAKMESEVASTSTKTTPARSVLVQHGRGV